MARFEIQAAKVRTAIFITEPAAHGIFECFRLLVDFLEHEMLELALFGVTSIPVDLMNMRFDVELS